MFTNKQICPFSRKHVLDNKTDFTLYWSGFCLAHKHIQLAYFTIQQGTFETLWLETN